MCFTSSCCGNEAAAAISVTGSKDSHLSIAKAFLGSLECYQPHEETPTSEDKYDELWLAQFSQRKFDEAKKKVTECKTGYFIVYDRENNRVYYRHADSETRIPTKYTEEHIEIAHRVFPPDHPHHIKWDRLNSEMSKYRRDYYVAPQS